MESNLISGKDSFSFFSTSDIDTASDAVFDFALDAAFAALTHQSNAVNIIMLNNIFSSLNFSFNSNGSHDKSHQDILFVMALPSWTFFRCHCEASLRRCGNLISPTANDNCSINRTLQYFPYLIGRCGLLKNLYFIYAAHTHSLLKMIFFTKDDKAL